MTTLVPMYHNTSSVLINPGYEPWIVIANQVFGGPPGYGSVGAVIGPPLVQQLIDWIDWIHYVVGAKKLRS